MTDAAPDTPPARAEVPAEASGIGPLGTRIGALLGPALALLMLLAGPPEGLPAPGWHTLRCWHGWWCGG